MFESIRAKVRTGIPFSTEVYEYTDSRIKLRRSRRNLHELIASGRELLLDIGGGYRSGTNGWLTVDMSNECDIYWDLRLGMPFPNNSVAKIYSSHLFEHLTYTEGQKLMDECLRVLRPGGRLYISEPAYDGPFNDVMRIFHDEGVVRAQATEAIASALKDRLFLRERQVMFYQRIGFANFDEFRRRMMHVTHTDHRFNPELVARIEEAYAAHQSPLGAHFIRPMRVDVLVKG